jgi:hypothetical protein
MHFGLGEYHLSVVVCTIDQGSQASDLCITNSAPCKEASERNTQMLLRISKSPGPPSVQLPLANSSVAMSMLTIGMNKEEPQARNLEIEAMRENMTETEQHQKADHTESKAPSPQSSFPGTPSTPNLFSSDGGYFSDQADNASAGSFGNAGYFDSLPGKERLSDSQQAERRRARNRENQRASRMYSPSTLLPTRK